MTGPAAQGRNGDGGESPAHEIAHLDLRDPSLAAQVHDVGVRAYRVEAQLIGFEQIPALQETVEQMQARPLRWTAALSPGGHVLAFVAWQVLDHGTLDLDRVCVAPEAFRRGLATALVTHVVEAVDPPRVTVSTGAANAPALALYERLGFRRTGLVEPVPGLQLAQLELTRS